MSVHNFSDPDRRDMERHLLAAVDESANSRRAVLYLADFFGDYRDIFITLLSIIAEPSEDYFATVSERKKWLADKSDLMEQRLAEYRDILLSAGLTPEQIESRLIVRQCSSIADAILEEQDKLRCCIVAVGRRGLSHNAEFILGSTSSKILHHAKHCAVLVVE
ncbi:MAG: universal stress protein [Deltaproteobacteria bacterium]|jgi:nucleotide-binding universal stress UspA family protein|nr:universal stress protein [Deltaproteobacteria bacterium]